MIHNQSQEGAFITYDSTGDAIEAYHANRAGNLAMFARKEGGGGVMAYDISDPSTPTFIGDVKQRVVMVAMYSMTKDIYFGRLPLGEGF